MAFLMQLRRHTRVALGAAQEDLQPLRAQLLQQRELPGEPGGSVQIVALESCCCCASALPCCSSLPRGSQGHSLESLTWKMGFLICPESTYHNRVSHLDCLLMPYCPADLPCAPRNMCSLVWLSPSLPGLGLVPRQVMLQWLSERDALGWTYALAPWPLLLGCPGASLCSEILSGPPHPTPHLCPGQREGRGHTPLLPPLLSFWTTGRDITGDL